MNVERVEQIVSSAIQLSGPEELRMPPESRRKWGRRLALGVAAAILEVLVLRGMGFSPLELAEGLALVEGLCILFAVWMCLFMRERLPVYYDEHRISFYSDGVFRMNLAGMRLHNGNWPHILNAGRRWLIGVIAVFPALYGVIRLCLPESVWVQGRLALYLAACLGLFVPMFVAGKRHES